MVCRVFDVEVDTIVQVFVVFAGGVVGCVLYDDCQVRRVVEGEYAYEVYTADCSVVDAALSASMSICCSLQPLHCIAYSSLCTSTRYYCLRLLCFRCLCHLRNGLAIVYTAANLNRGQYTLSLNCTQTLLPFSLLWLPSTCPF